MPDIGTAYSQMFRVSPTQQPGVGEQTQITGEQQQAPSIGAFPTGLENVQGITRGLYKKWTSLQSFATRMWESHRIDVTKPDFDNPAALQAHDVFNQAIADMYYTADTLKNSQKIKQSIAPYIASISGLDIEQPVGRETQLGDIRDLRKTPRVELAEKIANRIFTTQKEADKAQQDIQGLVTAAEADLRQVAAAGQDTTELENEVEMLKSQRPTVRPYAPTRDYDYDRAFISGFKKQFPAIKDTAEQIAGVLTGVADYTPSGIRTPSGGLYLKTELLTGKKMGEQQFIENNNLKTKDLIVNSTLYDPETEEVMLRFEGGSSKEYGREDLEELLKDFARYNKTGFDEADINTYIEGGEKLLETPVDLMNPTVYYGEEGIQQTKEAYKPVVEDLKSYVEAKDRRIEDADKSFSLLFIKIGGIQSYNTEYGTVEVKRTGDDSYKLIDEASWEEDLEIDISRYRKGKSFTKKELKDLLEVLGYYSAPLEEEPKPESKEESGVEEPTAEPDSVGGLKEIKGLKDN